MSAADSEQATLADRIGEDVHNVLLLAPPLEPADDDACADLLGVAQPAASNVLALTYVQSPDQRLEVWRSRGGRELPDRLAIVGVGESTRSAAADAAGGPGPATPVVVETVSSPGNLTDVGIKLTGFLADWEGEDTRTVLCFHSITALLQYADLQRAYRFLHVLTGRVRAADGFGHYHMDPTAHDAQTANTLKALFDAVAEWDGTGWSVSQR